MNSVPQTAATTFAFSSVFISFFYDPPQLEEKLLLLIRCHIGHVLAAFLHFPAEFHFPLLQLFQPLQLFSAVPSLPIASLGTQHSTHVVRAALAQEDSLTQCCGVVEPVQS